MPLDNLPEIQPIYTRLSKQIDVLPSLGSKDAERVREYFLERAKKGVILIDVDRNLTDGNYKISENDMDILIHDVQDMGYLVCLNSSRSARKLRYWQEKVKTHFPTFAENGLIVDIPDPEAGLNIQIATDERALLFNDRFRKRVLDELKDKIKNKYPNVELRYCTDEEPEDAINEATALGSWKNTNDEFGIYINGWTRVKTTMFAFEKSKNGMKYDREFNLAVRTALDEIRHKIPYNRQVLQKWYEDDCSILVYPTQQNKSYIWRILLSYLGEEAKKLKLYHMGDGDEDNIFIDGVTVLGPANAKTSITSRPRYNTKIAPEGFTYTKGVKYHLQMIRSGAYD